MNPEVLTNAAIPPYGDSLAALENVLFDLDINDNANNSFFKRYILAASQAVQTYCGRRFVAEPVTDTYYMVRAWREHQLGRDAIPLSHWPLIGLTSVVETDDAQVSTTLVEGTDFIRDTPTARLIRLNGATLQPRNWWSPKVTTSYVAGYGSSAAEPHTVPASGPYTITVKNAKTGFAIVDMGVTYANGTTLTAVSGTPTAAGQYSVNTTTGVYTFDSADAGQNVIANYAWTTIPMDVQDAVTRLVEMRWDDRSRESNLKRYTEPGVIEKEYWVPNSTGMGNIPPDIRELIDAYRVPSIA